MLTFFQSCEKENIVYIDGNKPPNDETVERVVVENYVAKLYISLLGRQASEAEFNSGVSSLITGPYDTVARRGLIAEVHKDEAFLYNEYDIIRDDLLEGLDTAEARQYIQIFTNAILATNDENTIDWYNWAISRMELLLTAVSDLKQGVIDFRTVHKRCVWNHFYDDINMGTENFVIAVFQNLLFRYPTQSELIAATKMVDGSEQIVFLQTGGSKEDFIDIVVLSDEYVEAQVRGAYQRFLFREPTVEELHSAKIVLNSTNEIKDLQLKILMTDEYFGIR